jgi:hypothetical protein
MEEEVLSSEDCSGMMMNADDNEMRHLRNEVVELVERLNRVMGTRRAGMTGILPGEETGASVIDGPTTEEEEHVGEDDLGECSGSEAEEQAEHGRIGIIDEDGGAVARRRGIFGECETRSQNIQARKPREAEI